MRPSSTDDHWWQGLLPGDVTVPADAVALLCFLVLANGALFAPLEQGVVVRALFGLPLLFLVPGYGLVSSLFPGNPTVEAHQRNWRAIGATENGRTLLDRGVDWRERVALSFGASIALQPLFAVTLSVLGLGFDPEVVAATLSGFAVLGMGVAVVRRNRLPIHQRYRVPYDRWIATVNDGVFARRSRVDVLMNLGLAVVVVSALAGVGYAVVAPNHAESYTSASLLTEGEDGELVKNGYPDTIEGTSDELVLRLENNEGATTEYTVVGELQQVQSTESSAAVIQRQEVHRSTATLEPGESWTDAHTVEPDVAGEDLRLIYYVYRGDAPASPSTDTARTHVHVWVDVPADVPE